MPPDEGYWCEYAFHWTDVKTMWQLKMTKAEADAVMEMLSTRPVEVNVLVVNETAQQETGEPEPREEPEPTEELQNSVYGSCKEAKAAGKQRVRGAAESVQGKPGRRTGLPEGDGPVRAGRGRRWSGVRTVKSCASGHNATADPSKRKQTSCG